MRDRRSRKNTTRNTPVYGPLPSFEVSPTIANKTPRTGRRVAVLVSDRKNADLPETAGSTPETQRRYPPDSSGGALMQPARPFLHRGEPQARLIIPSGPFVNRIFLSSWFPMFLPHHAPALCNPRFRRRSPPMIENMADRMLLQKTPRVRISWPILFS